MFYSLFFFINERVAIIFLLLTVIKKVQDITIMEEMSAKYPQI